MGRHPQQPGTKGSQLHLQRLVNDPADPLGRMLRERQVLAPHETVTWLSPLASDDFAEYRDEAFIARLGLHSARMDVPLAKFWPAHGPQWDALAQTSRRRFLLIEGKSHRSELVSHCAARNARSLTKIRRALQQAQAFCHGDSATDWSLRHYQVANRLAHLYWLRQLNGIDAHLVFAYFVNDAAMRGPTSAEAWQVEIARVHSRLGLTDDPMPGFVHHLFVDVTSAPDRQHPGAQ